MEEGHLTEQMVAQGSRDRQKRWYGPGCEVEEGAMSQRILKAITEAKIKNRGRVLLYSLLESKTCFQSKICKILF